MSTKEILPQCIIITAPGAGGGSGAGGAERLSRCRRRRTGRLCRAEAASRPRAENRPPLPPPQPRPREGGAGKLPPPRPAPSKGVNRRSVLPAPPPAPAGFSPPVETPGRREPRPAPAREQPLWEEHHNCELVQRLRGKRGPSWCSACHAEGQRRRHSTFPIRCSTVWRKRERRGSRMETVSAARDLMESSESFLKGRSAAREGSRADVNPHCPQRPQDPPPAHASTIHLLPWPGGADFITSLKRRMESSRSRLDSWQGRGQRELSTLPTGLFISQTSSTPQQD
ncbi:uncharacterized protein LOC141938230 [Strix uralensis]|uniref:uncharacterized protein LOC141938230 n=1 Tax=Strix uralensis TaxID=36305 RepID=UPI003DA74437